ncbi:acyltransferase family protein [Clostridium tarantellae]|uniref:Acyltransferase family protein n=1 Tax=Clostridium tarantellae TaxID=39493 RepID=A0A6I1MGX6_9CLOT|nr:acyltransferase [Clostridium tarantellae]MPQ42625.1 acyltransferase family protein [Clostridium tarantellae]
MEFTKNQMKITKGVAILFMLLLHLFCTKDFQNLYKPIIIIGNVPLVYYLALFGDCCVAIYCFCSGYGLLVSYKNNKENYFKNNIKRLLKLYINFWIILVLFVLILGPIMGMGSDFPGDLKTFLLTFTALSPAYNGAWWFLTTYIFLVLSSPFLNKLVIKFNFKFILIASFLFYFVAYIQRIKGVLVFDNNILDWSIKQIALFGTSQFPFIVGVVFAHKKWYSNLYNRFNYVKYKNLLGMALIILMIIAHGFVETLFVAVFTGIVFICIFNLMDKPKWLVSLLNYLGDHSTNMWLTHMFFYMIYFKKLVYAPKYSILIFIWLIVLCLGASYLVNFIYKPIINLLDKRYKNNVIVNNENLGC